jgi:hypothetical protein
MPDNLKEAPDSGTHPSRRRPQRDRTDPPASDTRLPHAEATDKDYDELEALRRYLFTQR